MEGGAPMAADQFLEAVRRALRHGATQPHPPGGGMMALVLHLSALRPPAPRPHHRRVARVILQDVAARHDGQVFAFGNGDIALLCAASGLHDTGRAPTVPVAREASSARDPAGGPAPLAAALTRLLRIDAVDPARLISVWPLGTDHAALLAYAAARAAEGIAAPPPDDEPALQAGVVDEIGALIGRAHIHDLMQRQTAVVLLPPRERAPHDRLLHDRPPHDRLLQDGAIRSTEPAAMRPIFREVAFSIAALTARTGGAHAGSDPFLFRHIAAQLDRRMLELVAGQNGQGGALDPMVAARGAPPLHLNLTLGAILSPSFAAFAAACRAAGATAGIEVSLIEASADSRAFAAARAAVARAGMALVLDGVSHLAMVLAAPWLLETDLLKLDWSPRLEDLAEADRRDIASAIQAAGAHRIVLQRAGSEAAIRWGMALGIRRFQGRHIDAMLGASRIVGCALSGGCALRQCIERAGAIGLAGRAGCGNPALLDAAVPPRAWQAAGSLGQPTPRPPLAAPHRTLSRAEAAALP